jgi:hypothetical protein
MSKYRGLQSSVESVTLTATEYVGDVVDLGICTDEYVVYFAVTMVSGDIASVTIEGSLDGTYWFLIGDNTDIEYANVGSPYVYQNHYDGGQYPAIRYFRVRATGTSGSPVLAVASVVPPV